MKLLFNTATNLPRVSTRFPLYSAAALMIATLLNPLTGHAVPIGFTSESDFMAAIGGMDSQTLNFEDQVAGDTIANGSTLGGITIGYDIAGLDMVVSSGFDTTSGSHYLGMGDGGDEAFFSGDGFLMSFAETMTAIGMFFIGSPGDIGYEDDLVLSTAGGSVSNALAPYDTLADGGDVFFLGLVDADGFDSVSLGSFCCEAFLFNIDDITTARLPMATAVPEPSALSLLLLGFISLLRLRTYRPSV